MIGDPFTNYALDHIVSSKVLWSSSDGDPGVVDLESHLGPISNRIQVDTPLDESLG